VTKKRATNTGRTPRKQPHAIVDVALDELTVAPWNPRRISEAARKRLARGIKRFGMVQPLVARHEDHMLLGGHQRFAIAKELGMTTVPVVFVEGLTDPEAKALAVLLNNKEAQGEWEVSALTTLLEELAGEADDDLLHDTGFDDASLEKLLGTTSADDELTPVEVRPMPKMVWVLIGVPSAQYPDIADQVQTIALEPGVFCEVAANDREVTR
jgi:ParB-like chromosome segregation protein Spo0J